MNLRTRLLVFAICAGMLISANRVFNTLVAPDVSTAMTLSAVNGGDEDAAVARTFQEYKDLAEVVCYGMIAVTFAVCFARPVRLLGARSRLAVH